MCDNMCNRHMYRNSKHTRGWGEGGRFLWEISAGHGSEWTAFCERFAKVVYQQAILKAHLDSPHLHKWSDASHASLACHGADKEQNALARQLENITET